MDQSTDLKHSENTVLQPSEKRQVWNTSALSYTLGSICLAPFLFLLIAPNSSLRTNGGVPMFPGKENELSIENKAKVISIVRNRFPKDHVVIHLTNNCTSCSLGPQVQETGRHGHQIQMMYMQDYLPNNFPDSHKKYVISDPNCKVISGVDSSSLPVTLELQKSVNAASKLSRIRDPRVWRHNEKTK